MKAHHQVLILAFIFSLLSSLSQTSLSQTPPGPSPPPPPPCDDLSCLIPKEMFEEMLKNRNNDTRCAVDFYTYDSFIEAAKLYPKFGNTGDIETRKKEIAAFFGQTSHQTTGEQLGGTYNDGDYTWGYCLNEELNPLSNYCILNPIYPCYTGQSYKGRGPMQLTWNYNYGRFGESVAAKDLLLSNPGIVSDEDSIAFRAALWFWMNNQTSKPSCHDVIVGNWIPTQCDIDEHRLPGYGVITNIINGARECDGRDPEKVKNRIGFYSRYCNLFDIGNGDYLNCDDQTPFEESSCPPVASA